MISPVEDHNWTDPAGNRTAIGAGKVSHIWGLRRGGRRLTFWDPWLPLDESYEMCGPHRGRFRAVNLSASGSWVFVIGRRGDMFTRPYDFDLSGHDDVLLRLLLRGPARRRRRRADPAPRRAVDRAAEDRRADHRRDLDPQGRGRHGPPHPARRGPPRRRDRLLGARRRRPAVGRLDLPRHRPAAQRPAASQPARATPRRAASGAARTAAT